MDKDIKISVLMAVYNGEKYIAEAIRSILDQTFGDFEFIIVNDGSKDNTQKIISDFTDTRIKVINNEKNLGLISSLNKGLSEARGKYIARMDHDDIAMSNRLKSQYDFMENNPSIDLVGSWTLCIDENGKEIKISRNPTNPIQIKYELIFNNVLLHSSIFFRREKVVEINGYSMEYKHSEDYEMYTRPGKELVCANIPEVLFKLRIHNSSITGSDMTQPTVYSNTINIVFRNINKYIDISREEFDKITSLLIIKKPDVSSSFATLLNTLETLKAITNSFIKKNNLNKNEKKIVLQNYTGRKKMIIKHYIIGRYRKYLKKYA